MKRRRKHIKSIVVFVVSLLIFIFLSLVIKNTYLDIFKRASFDEINTSFMIKKRGKLYKVDVLLKGKGKVSIDVVEGKQVIASGKVDVNSEKASWYSVKVLSSDGDLVKVQKDMVYELAVKREGGEVDAPLMDEHDGSYKADLVEKPVEVNYLSLENISGWYRSLEESTQKLTFYVLVGLLALSGFGFLIWFVSYIKEEIEWRKETREIFEARKNIDSGM